MAGVIDAINKLFGGKDGKTLLESVSDAAGNIIDKYHMSPEDKLAMQTELDKALDQKRQFVLQLIQADQANTADARAMNTKIQGDKPSWVARNVPYLLDLGAMGIWGALTIYIIMRALKLIEANENADFNVVLGIYSGVTGVFMTVLNYHRGSSQGSVDKQKTLDRLTA